MRENLFEQVADLLHGLDEGMVPISVFFPYLPIPVHMKRDKWVCKVAGRAGGKHEGRGMGRWFGAGGRDRRKPREGYG